MSFQSTLPHGSDSDSIPAMLSNGISIHAPSRERPPPAFSFAQKLEISIHAPSRERLTSGKFCQSHCGFQSTLPHGSDQQPSLLMSGINGISIHAPSRERLSLVSEKVNSTFISIHAPSRERHIAGLNLPAKIKFQSTLPHGSDGMLDPYRQARG